MADLTTQILVEIRDEIRSTKEELRSELRSTKEELSSRIDQTNSRLDRLERRQVEGELRLGTAIATLTGVMSDLRDKLVEDHTVRNVVVDHERRLAALETR